MPRQTILTTQNQLLQSNNFSSASWTKQAGVTVTTDQIANPVDGSVDADLIDVTAAAVGTGFLQTHGAEATFPLAAGRRNTKSIWLKGVIGGEVVTLADPVFTGNVTTCNLTTSWQQFTLTDTIQSTAAGFWLRKSSGNQFYAWGAQLVLANWAGMPTSTTTAYITNPIRNIITNRATVTNRTIITSRALIT